MHETTGTGRLKAIREAAAEVVEIGGDRRGRRTKAATA